MEHFWDTTDTIPEGLGFSLYGGVHLCWLAAAVTLTVVCCIVYGKMSQRGKSCMKKAIAVLLLADELFKLIPMLILGRFKLSYLPFHLCSINLFLIAWHAWKPVKMIENFLYTVCIPGALAALLFPSWTSLPAANYMVIHSFTVHILLFLYPVMLSANREIKPRLKELTRSLVLLAAFAVLAFVLNQLWGTNFMFLSSADEGNPLYWFGQNWGSHLLGFPVIITAVILVMYAPIEIYHMIKTKSKV